MPRPLQAVGFFCEDVREEQAGTETLIGIYPDNMAVPGIPGMLHKLGIFVRINFDPESPPSKGTVVLIAPDDSRQVIGEFSEQLIQESRNGAVAQGTLIAGLKMRSTLIPFPVFTPGRFQLIAEFGDDQYLCATLGFKVVEPPSEATSSAPSPPA